MLLGAAAKLQPRHLWADGEFATPSSRGASHTREAESDLARALELSNPGSAHGDTLDRRSYIANIEEGDRVLWSVMPRQESPEQKLVSVEGNAKRRVAQAAAAARYAGQNSHFAQVLPAEPCERPKAAAAFAGLTAERSPARTVGSSKKSPLSSALKKKPVNETFDVSPLSASNSISDGMRSVAYGNASSSNLKPEHALMVERMLAEKRSRQAKKERQKSVHFNPFLEQTVLVETAHSRSGKKRSASRSPGSFRSTGSNSQKEPGSAANRQSAMPFTREQENLGLERRRKDSRRQSRRRSPSSSTQKGRRDRSLSESRRERSPGGAVEDAERMVMPIA